LTRARLHGRLDEREMKNYSIMPIGTLVRIQKINSIQETLDVSKEGLVGYITGQYTYSDNVTSYQVYIFNSSKYKQVYGLMPWYVTAV